MGKRQKQGQTGNMPRAEKLRRKIAETADAPKDVFLGLPLIYMTGRAEIHIENYGGILEYTQELVRVRTKAGTLKISGKQMKVEYYLNDEMQIVGEIGRVEFENREDGHC